MTTPSEPLNPIEWNCIWIIIGDPQAKFFNDSVWLHINVREQVSNIQFSKTLPETTRTRALMCGL